MRALKERLEQICTQVSEAIEDGARLIVLSQRGVTKDFAPIPSLLLTGAVHQHLVRERTRTRVGLVVEAGDAREVHHIALLIGYGAAAVNPYLAMATVEDLAMRGDIAGHRLRDGGQEPGQGAGQGRAQDMSKIGVSTVASYTGAQIFEAVGLGPEVIDTCFTGTTSRLGGVGFDVLAEEVRTPPPHGVPVRRRSAPRTGRWTSAASTSGDARASCTCSTRPPCSSSSTPPGRAGTRSSRSTRARSTSRPSG